MDLGHWPQELERESNAERSKDHCFLDGGDRAPSQHTQEVAARLGGRTTGSRVVGQMKGSSRMIQGLGRGRSGAWRGAAEGTAQV